MAAKITGTVTDILTEGFAEVTLPGQAGEGPRRCVAANDLGAKRGDEVELRPAKPWNDPFARWAYLQVPALFLLGLLLSRSGVWERILSGLILAALGFVMAWLMNRRARLRRRLEYRVIKIVQRAQDE